MESISDIEIPSTKIYSEKAIWIGTFLGGPLIAGYFISENFKAFHDKTKAKYSILITILFTILLFIIIFSIPDNVKIANRLIPLIYTVIAASLVKYLQGEQIQNHLESGGSSYGGWRIFTATVIGLCVTTASVLFVLSINEIANAPISKKYGALNHEILFNENNISEPEVDEIAHVLTKSDFFGNQQQMSVFARKESDVLFVVTIPLIEEAWNDQALISDIRHLQSNMQQFVSKGRIVIDLSSELDINDVKMRIE